ncbi:MAG: GntR family transcriptional regulator [Clostridiales bacterium]|nr:GntR family transcriptional regulator [Clostridiales bacterium]
MEILQRLPSENSRTYALRVLTHNIMNLELAPGSVVSENELSSLLNVSRTPIREALIELSRMELVEIFPQRGSYVTKIDYDLIEEARFMRVVLEKAVLELACQGISEEYIRKLELNLLMEEQHSDGSEPIEFQRLDNEFHQLIFEAVHRLRTYSVIRSQMVHFDRHRVLSLKTISCEKTIEDHRNILSAIKCHDRELACFLMERHLTRHLEERSELEHRFPGYFSK